jgi:glycosyltransferase involved in cell wall biosynthesis
VDLFYELSGVLDLPFLGVEGTHGIQESHRFADDYNVRIKAPTQDMREVWSQTKLVLMPSEYESYGMVAAEACVNGIPVIAHPTPGLKECLDWAGIFIDREDVEGYRAKIVELLTDEDAHSEAYWDSLCRGQELIAQTRSELETFVQEIRKLVR